MVSKVRGYFTNFTGKILTGNTVEETSIEGVIETNSVDTRDEGRNQHLRSADFFDVEAYPVIKFESKKIITVSDDKYKLLGEITIKGLTRDIELDVTFDGIVKDPFGNTKAIASATGLIKRSDFGLTWNAALETGGVLVGEDVHLELEAQAILEE